MKSFLNSAAVSVRRGLMKQIQTRPQSWCASFQETVDDVRLKADLDTMIDMAVIRQNVVGASDLCTELARSFDISIDTGGCEKNIPDVGPVLIAANHSYGLVDNIVLGALLEKQRPDFKFLTSQSLRQAFPSAADYMARRTLGVDFHAGSDFSRARSLLAGARHLAAGGCVGLYPAGRIGKPDGFSVRTVDYPWRVGVVDLMRLAGNNPVFVPVYFHKETPRALQFFHKWAHGMESTKLLNYQGLWLQQMLSISELHVSPYVRVTIGQACPMDQLLAQAHVGPEAVRRDKTARAKVAAVMQAMTYGLASPRPHL